jgi:nicotinate-nucleotide pyrophosphorylase (carboxylating)
LMIKDNHIAACGSLGEAVARVRAQAPHVFKVEVEVQSLEALEQALVAKADVIMLDNMPLDLMRQAVQRVRAGDWPALLEASGNMDLDRVRAVAETGVDVISVGALTHSAPSADLSMRLVS